MVDRWDFAVHDDAVLCVVMVSGVYISNRPGRGGEMDEEARASLEAALRRLIGVELSSVVFIRDYVQLYFDPISAAGRDYPRLTLYTWPTVYDRAGSRRLGDPDYRDSLCRLISAPVAGAALTDEDMRLWFADGAGVTISLLPGHQAMPETLMYTDGNDGCWVV
jgi:hypothetical protein